jgi:hypothetical protein
MLLAARALLNTIFFSPKKQSEICGYAARGARVAQHAG